MHLDENIVIQYGFFIKDLVSGDLGTSLYTNRPVILALAQSPPAPLPLVSLAAGTTAGPGTPRASGGGKHARRPGARPRGAGLEQRVDRAEGRGLEALGRGGGKVLEEGLPRAHRPRLPRQPQRDALPQLRVPPLGRVDDSARDSLDRRPLRAVRVRLRHEPHALLDVARLRGGRSAATPIPRPTAVEEIHSRR